MISETFCGQNHTDASDLELGSAMTVNHVFHQKCLRNWFDKGHLSCPVCRTNLYVKLQKQLNKSKEKDNIHAAVTQMDSQMGNDQTQVEINVEGHVNEPTEQVQISNLQLQNHLSACDLAL